MLYEVGTINLRGVLTLAWKGLVSGEASGSALQVV